MQVVITLFPLGETSAGLWEVFIQSWTLIQEK